MALGRASCEGGRASGWPLEWWVATWAAASQGTLSLLGGLPPHLGAQRLAWQHLGGKLHGSGWMDLDGKSCRNPHVTATLLLGCRRPPIQARFVRSSTTTHDGHARRATFPAQGSTGAAKRARTARKRASSPPAHSSSTACTAKPSEQRPCLGRKDESEGWGRRRGLDDGRRGRA